MPSTFVAVKTASTLLVSLKTTSQRAVAPTSPFSPSGQFTDLAGLPALLSRSVRSFCRSDELTSLLPLSNVNEQPGRAAPRSPAAATAAVPVAIRFLTATIDLRGPSATDGSDVSSECAGQCGFAARAASRA